MTEPVRSADRQTNSEKNVAMALLTLRMSASVGRKDRFGRMESEPGLPGKPVIVVPIDIGIPEVRVKYNG